MSQPQTPEELEERLEEHVDAVLSSRRTAREPAERLAKLDRSEQDFVLHWVAAVSKSNAEMGYQVANLAGLALGRFSRETVEVWVLAAMDAFDREGLTAGMAAIQALDDFAVAQQQQQQGVGLASVHGVLEGIVQGLSGRALKVEASEEAWTDTGTLFLPNRVQLFSDPRSNFELYKAMAAHLWAQCWYGTWQGVWQAEQWADSPVALTLWHALETIRLDACITRDLPGVARLQRSLSLRLKDEAYPMPWAEAIQTLSLPQATAEDSRAWVARLSPGPVPGPRCYQGGLYPQQVAQAREARMQQEKVQIRLLLAEIEPKHPPTRETPTVFEMPPPEPTAEAAPPRVLQLEDQPIEPPVELARLLSSVHQDLGEIPPEYLVAAGPGEYDTHAKPPDTEDVWKGVYHEEGAWHYQEWDHARGSYRKDWCVLRERPAHPRFDDFPERTLRKHRDIAQSLRRTFEMIRGAPATLRAEPHGDDLDLDALVRAVTEARSGHEMTQRVFVRQARNERNIAVMFMVDMSGSTKGWVNEVERESLILLCEALEQLQDRYAIYGFSGMTRKRCELFSIKRFDECYDDTVAARISGIAPQDYTRMGVAIRHLSELLTQVEARSKLLVTLSDGRPEDYTDYRGQYGIEDTRQALFEARRSGIHSFCITIDEQASEYLPHMYGAANYTVVRDIRRLPMKVSDIYRRLTS